MPRFKFKTGVVQHEAGYPRITAGRYRGEYLHILIYEWFHGPIPPGFDVHHIDGDKTNFNPRNLETVEHHDHGRISRRAQLEYAAKVERARKRRMEK